MKKVLSLLLATALLSGLLTFGSSAATLQSNQAVYQLSQDPVGIEPFSYSQTESHFTTLLPLGTTIRNELGAPLLIEVFVFNRNTNYWTLDSLPSTQSQLVIQDDSHIYHICTLDRTSPRPNVRLDRGIWVKGAGGSSSRPVTITGEPVDDWAVDLVNQAISANLMPSYLRGQDLRLPITRAQFASLSVRLYESMSGITVPLPAKNPFTDTSDPDVQKAYSMGFTAGKTASTFGPNDQLTREQAATMLTSVYKRLGGSVPAAASLPFRDQSHISSWARDSVSFMSKHHIIAGYEDGRFAPKDTAQRQACLIMALRMQQLHSTAQATAQQEEVS